jgi:hypothetical protein
MDDTLNKLTKELAEKLDLQNDRYAIREIYRALGEAKIAGMHQILNRD